MTYFPTSTLTLDSSGVSLSNRVLNEVHSSISEPDIITAQGPFYLTSMSVTGVPSGGGASVPLTPYVDYTYSPLFTTLTSNTGQQVVTYILLNNWSNWSSVSLTYQAVGGVLTDIELATEIVAAGNFDRTNIYNWLSFTGDSSLNNLVNQPIDNISALNILSAKLSELAIASRSPSSFVTLFTNQLVPLSAAITTVQNQLSSGGLGGITQAIYVQTSGTITLNRNTGHNVCIFNAGATVASLTVNLYSAPADGDTLKFSFLNNITDLIIGNGTLNGFVSGNGVPMDTSISWQYVGSLQKWIVV